MRQATFSIRRVKQNGSTFYSIYVPAYLSPTGKKAYQYFSTKADAERRRGELLAATRTESKLTELSNAQVRDAQRALERIAEAGLDLTLDKAIELALPSLKAAGRNISVDQLFTDFSAAKANDWSEASKRSFATSAKTFLKRWSGRILSTIDPDELSAWYEVSFASSGYRAHEIRTIRPAFSWAVRRKLLQESPFARMEGVRVKRQPIAIYTPAEAERLMRSCPIEARAAFALLLFAGVRPKELTRLTWGNIRDGYIHITAAIAKTQQVRNIEMEPNLVAWLASTGTHEPDEPVCPPDWVRKSRAIRADAGVHAVPDTPRHSYASYHLAAHKDLSTLKANLGHAPNSDTLFVHYRAAATPRDAERYWSILPSL
ncbi:MAG: hypothetical protein E7032_08875 [Akkermansiaceae bacterium]|nr:hypothetical protein [Akkermansiaceae bacterium]